MNILAAQSSQINEPRPRAVRAFTLAEVMVTLAVSMLVMAGMITIYLFTMRLLEFSRPKLSASDNARNLLTRIIDDLRSATDIEIGSGDSSSFTECTAGTAQQGSAIKVYGSTNTNDFVVYYLDTSEKRLKYRTNGVATILPLASSVSNSVVFTSEDYAGNVLTNNQNNRVVGVTLQFSQIEYPIIKIGSGQFYDSYQIRTRVTRRSLF